MNKLLKNNITLTAGVLILLMVTGHGKGTAPFHTVTSHGMLFCCVFEADFLFSFSTINTVCRYAFGNLTRRN